MSFWNTSDGNLNVTGNFDMDGSEPIPANTELVAMPTNAQWTEWQDAPRYVDIEWTVVDGQYKNRKVFQKIRVFDEDPKRRDRAIRMLAAIDANAGGNLRALGREPSDSDLQQHLMHKVMRIKVMVWELDGKSGNWVSAVSSANGQQPQQQVAQQQPAPQQQAVPNFAADDTIPF